ncbi:3TM-type holin [Tenacibaculum ovolyticum]|uniref:3TM-type holin n=1 Tax=Tenacibaculum ovolyticum TaxID=104270 RepID=UPI0007ED712A|nr:3TM-type holin [Tenacibaculum ovolyticum]
MDKILSGLSTILKMDKFWNLFKGKERLLLEFQAEMSKLIHESNLKQMEVNIQEAKHESVFVAGWRPFIGWVCGSALAYQFILRDLISLIFELKDLPQIELTHLVGILLAMLGMGGLRSYEKLKKVN